MNCDQVFEVLTCCTPANGTAADCQIEQHLSGCPSCRRLADALRPAVALFENVCASGAGDRISHHSARWQSLVTEEACEAEPGPDQQLTRITAACTAARRSTVGRQSWRLAAAVLIGLGLGIMAAGFAASRGWQSNQLADVSGQPISTVALPTEMISSLGLAAACLPHVDGHHPAGGHASPLLGIRNNSSTIQLACCTQCHRADAQTAAHWATSQIANTCQLCHLD